MKLTEAQCKMLGEFIGECWHETVEIRHSEEYGDLYKCSCGAIDCEKSSMHRTFTTWADIEPVKKALEKGLWEKFDDFCSVQWDRKEWFYLWLFGEDEEGYRLCRLAAEFIERLPAARAEKVEREGKVCPEDVPFDEYIRIIYGNTE
jgi:hypothetical protein